MTVEELVNARGLSLRLAAGKQGGRREIQSAQTCELDDPLEWIRAGTLLLRTDWGTEALSDRDAALVPKLSAAGIAGVGIGVYTPDASPCARLREVADEVGLPILMVTPPTSYQQVAAYVFAHNTSVDTYELKRIVSLHDMLLARYESSGLDGVMEEVCSLLGAQILLLGDGGSVQRVWSSGQWDMEPIAKRLWGTYVTDPCLLNERDLGSAGVAHVAEICCGGEWLGLLACIGRLPADMANLRVPIISFLKGLLQVHLGDLSVRRRTQRESREALLQQMARGGMPAYRVAAALGRHSISRSDRLFAVLLCRTPDPMRSTLGTCGGQASRPDVAADVVAAVEQFMERQPLPFLVGRLCDCVALVLPATPSPGVALSATTPLELLTELSQQIKQDTSSLDLFAGVSEDADLADMPAAFSHAWQALERAQRVGDRTGRVVLFSDLGIEQEVVNALPGDLLEKLRAGVAGRLLSTDSRRAPRLLEVLSSFVDHDCSTADTARALFVHRNTVRRQLAEIEKILGVDLAACRDLAEVRLAIRADAVVRSRQPW